MAERIESRHVVEASEGSLRLQLYAVLSTAKSLGAVKEHLAAHRAYLRQLEASNVLFAAGPLWTDDGVFFEGDGLLVYRAASVEEARAQLPTPIRCIPAARERTASARGCSTTAASASACPSPHRAGRSSEIARFRRTPAESSVIHSTPKNILMIGTFTPSDSALLLIDHQVGTMKLIKNIPLDVVTRNTLALAKTAKILGIPVVLTSSQEENLQGPLLPELEGILPEAFKARVKRAGIVNAWNDAEFKAAVETTRRRNLIMAGVTTDVCLVYPAISARREGYQVQAVMDASGSPFDPGLTHLIPWESP